MLPVSLICRNLLCLQIGPIVGECERRPSDGLSVAKRRKRKCKPGDRYLIFCPILVPCTESCCLIYSFSHLRPGIIRCKWKTLFYINYRRFVFPLQTRTSERRSSRLVVCVDQPKLIIEVRMSYEFNMGCFPFVRKEKQIFPLLFYVVIFSHKVMNS